jgi:LysM repeat protein
MAPITSPRKRLNWLTILEVLMGIVVLGGIVLVIWLMISLIPGAGGLNYTVPANASTTREVTATMPPATATEAAAVATVSTDTPFPTLTPTEAPTPTPEPTDTPEMTATPEITETPGTTASPNTTATAAAESCEYPEGWAAYTVQSGDVLINLAEFFGLTLAELQEGNCMDDGTLIYPGDVIYLPEINENTAEPAATEEP